MQLLVKGCRMAGVRRITAMQDSSHHAFARVDGNACPFAEKMHFSTLGMKVCKGASECTSIISIPKTAGVVSVLESRR